YKEVINTDADIYGGSNCGNAGLIETEDKPWSDFPFSAELTLPPLGGLLLIWNSD
ncbi:MAG: alpha amylase C-terminal domain-containing protein, partial [Gammaproteobacteria bacterium]|nr:alpha amylase C-terminal domain-containing protein [Gammaproteobacteria bacterium]